mmetsp:Transcript_12760/g.24138  ORF Transcript_12760/g.24138 Transcript_12760/m.24138 type:complete len:217 (-) Transcript_12760:2882-3532(-)
MERQEARCRRDFGSQRRTSSAAARRRAKANARIAPPTPQTIPQPLRRTRKPRRPHRHCHRQQPHRGAGIQPSQLLHGDQRPSLQRHFHGVLHVRHHLRLQRPPAGADSHVGRSQRPSLQDAPAPRFDRRSKQRRRWQCRRGYHRSLERRRGSILSRLLGIQTKGKVQIHRQHQHQQSRRLDGAQSTPVHHGHTATRQRQRRRSDLETQRRRRSPRR